MEQLYIFVSFQLEFQMTYAMDEHDEQCLDGISDEVAVPQETGYELRDEPDDGNDRQRQGEGDKQGHAMMGIELVDNHDNINIAEGDETQWEDA